MRSLVALGLALACLVLSATGPAAAQPEDRVARARQLFQEGTAAYAAGRFEEAARKFEEGYGLVRSPELAYNVARAYERMSEYDAAIRYFRIYLRTGQLDDTVRGDIESRIVQLEEAKRRQREQVFTAPPTGDELTNEARTFFQRGVTMFQRRQYEAAMQAFTAALRFAPLPEIYYNMAVTAERLRRHRDAYDYYRDYLRLRPESPDRATIERRMEELRGQHNE